MGSQLDADIARAMTAVRRRKIVQRIIDVVRHYGGGGAHAGAATLTIAAAPTLLAYDSYGPYHEFTRITASYGGELVFEAHYTDREGKFADADQRRVIRGDGYSLMVDTYLPGIWMRALELKRLIREEANAKRRAERERERAARESARPPVVREHDDAIAERFGLR